MRCDNTVKNSYKLGDSVHPDPTILRFPAISCNREKYSEPEDVLIPRWPDMGIFRFQVKDIPPKPPANLRGATPRDYTFRVDHDPNDANYSHSEVRLYVDDLFNRNYAFNNKRIKLWFRTELSRKTVVIREPKASVDL